MRIGLVCSSDSGLRWFLFGMHNIDIMDDGILATGRGGIRGLVRIYGLVREVERTIGNVA